MLYEENSKHDLVYRHAAVRQQQRPEDSFPSVFSGSCGGPTGWIYDDGGARYHPEKDQHTKRIYEQRKEEVLFLVKAAAAAVVVENENTLNSRAFAAVGDSRTEVRNRIKESEKKTVPKASV
ncbi:hypothetical protein OUZ56_000849 [Daphnia magna]|uniref:Uncharacterized protein n=1 Tax=Daphnia magna TaxID=35525 RepID=A0ABR0A1I1_9CRUS|nr:hypothetical protein OUZ56_000849 [Daphnia magna]